MTTDLMSRRLPTTDRLYSTVTKGGDYDWEVLKELHA